MNWILGTVSLVVLFLTYFVLGEFIDVKLLKKNFNNIKKIIVGFFSLHLLCFLTGEIGIFFGLSWHLYFMFTLIIVVLFVLISFFNIKDCIYFYFRQNLLEIVLEHLKKYWLVYVLIIILSIFSICNSNAYYQMNYDDGYYIGKVANLIESPKLLNEGYFLGNITHESVRLERLINTYELSEAFLSSLFHISPAFFCRFVMVINNYFIIFFVYIELAKEFLDVKNIQFVLLPFFILLIPHSYLGYGSPIKIKLYDGWQFQSAIFYGGSIVRCAMIPTILLFGKDLIKSFKAKEFIFIGLLCIIFVSFSTIALQIIFLMLISLSIIYMFRLFNNFLLKSISRERLRIILSLFLTMLLLGFLLILFENCKLDSFAQAISEYIGYYGDYVNNNLIFNFGFIFLIISIVIFKGIPRKYTLILFWLYFIFRTNLFYNLITLTSFKFFFVSMRTITSISMMILFFMGVLLLYFSEKINISSKVFSYISGIGLISALAFTYLKIDIITYYTYGIPSGMAKSGYTLNPLLDNDQLLPEEIVEIGEYFNNLPYGNYKIMLPIEYEHYKDIGKITMTSLYSASNRDSIKYLV